MVKNLLIAMVNVCFSLGYRKRCDGGGDSVGDNDDSVNA